MCCSGAVIFVSAYGKFRTVPEENIDSRTSAAMENICIQDRKKTNILEERCMKKCDEAKEKAHAADMRVIVGVHDGLVLMTAIQHEGYCVGAYGGLMRFRFYVIGHGLTRFVPFEPVSNVSLNMPTYR